ncbi:hypothetical protein [Serratia bockelmannii]|uniref:hypothetical protein n=1 Tax=Serratia bockelmannii TaxID=2703793 RepID=UPI002362BE47|nr:hypothetical protein [Serratia bockelmannii]
MSATTGAYKVPVGKAFWRYMPVIASAKVYSDAAWTTPATGAVTITGADKKTYASNSAVKNAGQASFTSATGLGWGAGNAVALSDGYMDNGGYAPLTFNGSTTTSDTLSTTSTSSIKSAVLGVTSLIALNPEDAAGNLTLTVPKDGDKASMPFTITVNYV